MLGEGLINAFLMTIIVTITPTVPPQDAPIISVVLSSSSEVSESLLLSEFSGSMVSTVYSSDESGNPLLY